MAANDPGRQALVIGDGEVSLTYGDLDERSNQVAHACRSIGLGVGDGIAIMMENDEHFVEVWWGGMRSGLYVTPVNWHLTPGEVAYLLADSGARVLFHGIGLADVVEAALADGPEIIAVSVGGDRGPTYDEMVRSQPTGRIDDEAAGSPMFYSSGTTGRPKGIRPPLSGGPPDDGTSLMYFVASNYGVTPDARYLSTGPLYHSAPIAWTTAMHTIGAASVVMRRFDAEQALQLIEHQQITHTQWVPTMFQRLLRLPEEVRDRYDLSTHREAWHAAAPCPAETKRQMIEWWGPILREYYAGSEGGGTIITSQEWLEHPGSVGRHWSGGTIHILDPVTREELPPGSEGLIFFDAVKNYRFEYHNDTAKTAEAYHGDLITLGDIGKVDEDGYLYLTDRKSHMIISGGVNIYPREVEEVLLLHPAVADVAVFGIPDEEFGEQVLAAVQLDDPAAACDDLVGELIAHCRANLAGYKCPKRVDFFDDFPRDPNGKLYKRRLRDRYWQGRESRIV